MQNFDVTIHYYTVLLCFRHTIQPVCPMTLIILFKVSRSTLYDDRVLIILYMYGGTIILTFVDDHHHHYAVIV